MTAARAFAFALLIGQAAAGCGGAPPESPERAAFAMVSTADTVLFDDFARTAAGIEGRITARGSLRQKYVMTLGARAAVTRLEVDVYAPGVAAADTARVNVTARWEGDSVVVRHRRPSGLETRRFAVPAGGLLGVVGSAAFLEQIVRRHRALGGDSLGIPVFLPENSGIWEVKAFRLGADSARVVLSGEEWRFATDGEGRILGGRAVSTGLAVSRLPSRDRR